MLDRTACERRVYRLAVLLTGNPIAAAKVISQVVGAQPDLAQLDSAHMDRLTVLRSREIQPSAVVSEAVPTSFATALSALTAQQREAWVLACVYQTPRREMSRAMDCSSHATERHLQLAEAEMARATGATSAAVAETLLRYSMSLDVPEFFRAAERRRRRVRLVFLLAIIAAVALVVAWVATWWSRPLEGDRSPNSSRSPAATSVPAD